MMMGMAENKKMLDLLRVSVWGDGGVGAVLCGTLLVTTKVHVGRASAIGGGKVKNASRSEPSYL
jgi:hypothetical protein